MKPAFGKGRDTSRRAFSEAPDCSAEAREKTRVSRCFLGLGVTPPAPERTAKRSACCFGRLFPRLQQLLSLGPLQRHAQHLLIADQRQLDRRVDLTKKRGVDLIRVHEAHVEAVD